MVFTDELHEHAEPIWDALLEHPMIQGISDGSLDESCFQYWLKQDYQYLIDYARLLSYGTATAPTLDHMTTCASLLESTLTTELPFTRELATKFNISNEELTQTQLSPTTQAYTDFLIRTATTGTFGDIIAILLPCLWGFNRLGTHLITTEVPDQEWYAEWIELYASESFTTVAESCKDLMNTISQHAAPQTRDRYRDVFLTAVRYEYQFWDAAWHQEHWPI